MSDGAVRTHLSPERLAAILSALVAVLLVSTQGFASGGAAVVPTPSATPSPSVTLAPTMDPVIRSSITTALVVNQRLAERADALEAATEATPPSGPDIATILRSINADVASVLSVPARLQGAPSTAALGDDLEAFYGALRDQATETLKASIQSVPTYVDGGTAMLVLLADLPALDDRLADALAGRAAGSSPPSASPIAATPTASAPPTPSPTPSPTSSPVPTVTSGPGSPAPSATPFNLLANGDFELGLVGWDLSVAPDAAATANADASGGVDGSGGARVDITVDSPARAGISLVSSPVRLDRGAVYEVRVAARAAAPRELRIRLVDDTGKTTTARVFQIGPAWSDLTFTVTDLVGDSANRLALDLGRSDATTWFDAAAISRAGS